VFLLQDMVPWAVDYPASAVVPVADWVSALMGWIKSNLSWLTRSITAVLGVPLDFALNLLAKNFKIGHGADTVVLPRLSWVGVCAVAFLAGHAVGGRKLSLLVGGCFLYIALFGQWTSAMLTLALISIAVPFCIVTGLFAGIWAWRKPWAERLIVSPALDLMQTIPTFAYLIPMLLLFGNSPVSAMIATAIFATPPMVRATMLGLSRVPSEIDDFSEMAGCTARQKLWRVLLPSARPTLMVGVNQVIMLALNMVIIASMIGAGGLGYDVLLALRALKVGEAMEAGLAIVALAIALDRLSQAIAHKQAKGHVHQAMNPSLWRRYPNLTLAIAILAVTTLLGLFVPAFAAVPKAITFTTAPLWKAAVNWVTINFFDAIEAFRVALILNVLNPLRAFCEGFPWLGAVAQLVCQHSGPAGAVDDPAGADAAPRVRGVVGPGDQVRIGAGLRDLDVGHPSSVDEADVVLGVHRLAQEVLGVGPADLLVHHQGAKGKLVLGDLVQIVITEVVGILLQRELGHGRDDPLRPGPKLPFSSSAIGEPDAQLDETLVVEEVVELADDTGNPGGDQEGLADLVAEFLVHHVVDDRDVHPPFGQSQRCQ